MRLLIYYMTDKITDARAFICKLTIDDKLAAPSQSQWSNFSQSYKIGKRVIRVKQKAECIFLVLESTIVLCIDRFHVTSSFSKIEN